ncbi:hypothetical protein HK413_06820 [Mucilaginibacter sp. S1162]|uniref:DUF4288 domain-containing protein n=1 Tax=Mucilaginibacter humi TaxID=2732510 RepID=A0ABX1W2Q3_9SPHI|nr:hypothetical protein [Mucilaginibacter humi]NNU33936.1 hypothetical protein [Mucilaginibacter humi]
MNLLFRVLSRLSAGKGSTVEPVIRFNDDWKKLNVEDKVKKQIITRTSWENQSATYSEEYYYGKIILIDDGYAVVKYKHLVTLEREMLKDLLWVSELEWKKVRT